MEESETAGDAVRELREEAGLSQEALAEKAETDLRQLDGIERGTRNPSYEYLHRLAVSLGSGVGEITTRADNLRSAN